MDENTKGQLTLLQEDTHANHLVLPGSDEARQMTAISGRNLLESYKRLNLDGLLAKMLLDTSVWASTVCYLTWKDLATPGKRLLFRLVPSQPRTDEIESGLLHTPPAAANQMAPSMRERNAGSWGLWLTPTTNESVQDIEKFKKRMEKYDNGTTMPNLATQVMFPTPTAQESGPMPELSHEPAPNVRNYSKKTGNHCQMTLSRYAQLWPTPKERDWKDGRSAGTHDRNSPDLGKVVGQNLEDGALNPAWVEWLMGYPEGWTELEDSETLLSHKSQK
jgi:hypothetical protein